MTTKKQGVRVDRKQIYYIIVPVQLSKKGERSMEMLFALGAVSVLLALVVRFVQRNKKKGFFRTMQFIVNKEDHDPGYEVTNWQR
jgi:hypothetical protein